MTFKPPGGELTFWSALWVLFGVAAIVAATTMGLTGYYVLGALVGLPALGMWFDQRWCGYVFAGLMALTIPLALLALVTVDDTWPERGYRLVRVGMSGYFAFIAFRWAQDD
tara:strand:- start:2289 stop:2621 length:333 start_codon:yes stop_codon:yes gene_type:complete